MCQLPALVLGLCPEGFMKVDEGKKRTTGEKTENEADNLPLHFNELADGGPEPNLNNRSDGNDNLPSYLNKEEEREVIVITKDITGNSKDRQQDQPNDTESPNEIVKLRRQMTQKLFS